MIAELRVGCEQCKASPKKKGQIFVNWHLQARPESKRKYIRVDLSLSRDHRVVGNDSGIPLWSGTHERAGTRKCAVIGCGGDDGNPAGNNECIRDPVDRAE